MAESLFAIPTPLPGGQVLSYTNTAASSPCTKHTLHYHTLAGDCPLCSFRTLQPSPAKSVSPVLPKAAGAPKRATGPSPAARRELLPPPGSARRGTAAAAPTSVPPHGAAGTAAGLGELPALVGLSAPPGVGKPPRGGTKATAAAPAAALPPLSRSRLGGGASSAGGVTGSRLGGALQPLGFVDEGLGGLDGDGDGGLGALGGERDAKRLNFGTGACTLLIRYTGRDQLLT